MFIDTLTGRRIVYTDNSTIHVLRSFRAAIFQLYIYCYYCYELITEAQTHLNAALYYSDEPA